MYTSQYGLIIFFISCPGKGLGSLVAGQLLGQTSLDTPGLFQWSFGVFSGFGLAILITYHIWGKKYEKEIVAEKAALLERIKQEAQEKTTDNNNNNNNNNNNSSEKNGQEDTSSNSHELSTPNYTKSWVSSSIVSTKF